MTQVRTGRGAFQWNAGGWFGGQIGATVWLVLLGSLLVARGVQVGWAVLGLGLIPNLVGTALWQQRTRLAAYPALQILLAVSGSAALIAMLVLRAVAPAERQAELPSLWLLSLYPALMAMFYLRERSSRRALPAGD